MAKAVNIRKEKCDVYCGRGSKYGNPYVIGEDGNRDNVISLYRNWLWNEIQTRRITIKELQSLNGKKLGCYCKPKPCHCDVIVRAIKWSLTQ
tara:strand:- start:9987 stop:10262 length:276 start_codon:yes stop_codon:yes gene_type:complete